MLFFTTYPRTFQATERWSHQADPSASIQLGLNVTLEEFRKASSCEFLSKTPAANSSCSSFDRWCNGYIKSQRATYTSRAHRSHWKHEEALVPWLRQYYVRALQEYGRRHSWCTAADYERGKGQRYHSTWVETYEWSWQFKKLASQHHKRMLATHLQWQ